MKIPYEWKSVFAEAAQNFISLQRQTGMKFEMQERYLRHFDTFYYCNGFEGATLTKGMIFEFIYDKNESSTSHRNKEIVMRNFAIYLADRGYTAYIPELRTVIPRCKFVPQILTDAEMCRFFAAIDNYPLKKQSYRNSVDPVLFRFLYGTGVRISEALNIILSDVDAKTGVVTVHDGKNGKDRLLPMADGLTKRIISFMNSFHSCNDSNMWLFPACKDGIMGRMDKSTAYNHFRDYLLMADIPHTAVGPRIHSLRHGFAVKCLKKWVLAGNDLNVMLPYLSAYMGHADFRGTQYYLRLTSDLYPDILKKVEAEFGYVIPEGGLFND